MIWTKTKIAIATALGIALGVGGSAMVTLTVERSNRMAALELLKQTEAAYASLETLSFEGKSNFETHSRTNDTDFSCRLSRPCSYRSETRKSRSDHYERIGWTTPGHSNSYIDWLSNTLYRIPSTPEDRLTHFQSLTLDGVMGGDLPSGFFFNTNLDQPFRILASTNAGFKISLQGDEKVGSDDCSRLVVVVPRRKSWDPLNTGLRLTLWIGKADHLIHQSEQWLANGESDRKRSYPARQWEVYENIRTNIPFSDADFLPEDGVIPSGLTVSGKFP